MHRLLGDAGSMPYGSVWRTSLQETIIGAGVQIYDMACVAEMVTGRQVPLASGIGLGLRALRANQLSGQLHAAAAN